MFDSHAFYKQRVSSHMKELSRYLRYIFNGHIAVATFFFIAAIAYYYQAWLAQLPENFPTAIIIGIAFGLLASYSPIRTLLKEPDLVFLIVAEEKMRPYFRNAIFYSFFIQLYVVLLVAAALGPLYTTTFSDREGSPYLLTIFVLLIYKVANLLVNWWMYRVRESRTRRLELFIRTIINILVFYFLVAGEILLASFVTIAFTVGFLFIYSLSKKKSGVLWDLLLEKDQNRMQSFYRIANMFSDVPHIKSRISKRKWLVSLLTKNITFEKKYTFDYLYRITFIRSGDYLGMYLRLIVVGGIFIVMIPTVWMKVLFAILFIYLSSFQMMALYKHHRTVMWLDIYPIVESNRQSSMLKLLYQLGFLQTVIYAALFLFDKAYLGSIVALGAGAAFTYLFTNGYIKKKII